MRPMRFLRSAMSFARQMMAISSDATVMSKPSSLGTPEVGPPRPTTTWRRARSLMSTTRFQIMRLWSMPSWLPWWIWLSIKAAKVLLAAVKACMSPVKWRLMSSIGTTWEYPPPVAPPFMPITGPSDGSRKAIIVFLFLSCIASANPTVTVDLPSPAGVGLIAVTKTSLRLVGSWSLSGNEIFALYLPYWSISSSVRPARFATSPIGSIVHFCAISISFNAELPSLSWMIQV